MMIGGYIMLRFEWEDQTDIGHYEVSLYDGDKKLEDMYFTDYTCQFHQDYDKERHYARPYSFEVGYCNGWSMSQGFDYDAEYYDHLNKDGTDIGGYQGNCTHTVADIKKWCEDWLAQQYIDSYQSILARIDIARERAEWFVLNGYGSPEEVK